jgi:APA family basic amino acid/polyamine antiporter
MTIHEGELKRVLGPISAACVVIGAIIGVGIFFTPSQVAASAGSGQLALMAWCLGGVIALVGALTFAELGGMYPRSGGQYEILRDAYGSPLAFLFVFCNATAVQAGAIAVIALVFADNLSVLILGQSSPTMQSMQIAVLSIVVLTMANIAGVQWGSKIQNLTVATKLAALLVIILAAIFFFTPSAIPKTSPSKPLVSIWSGLFAALVPVLFSFGGWQHALWIAGEIKDPQKNIPRAIIGGVMVVIVVYVAAAWAYFDLLGYSGVANSRTLAADAINRFWPSYGSRVIALAVSISAFGVLNAQLLSGPRLIMAMSRDGKFFKLFGRIHHQAGTPHLAILLLTALGLALLVAGGSDGTSKIVTGVVFIDSTFFVLTGFALLVLRWRRPTAPRPVRVPLYPIVPLLFVLGECAVIAGSLLDQNVRESSYIGMVWIVGAFICYVIFFRNYNEPNPAP